MRQYRLYAIEGAGQVDGDDPVPVLGTHLADHSAYRGAGAVDEDVDTALGFGDAGSECGKRGAVGDVDGMGRGGTIAAFDLCCNHLGGRKVSIEDRDARTRRGEAAASRGADPVPSAGDEGDLSGKIVSHSFNSPSPQLV